MCLIFTFSQSCVFLYFFSFLIVAKYVPLVIYHLNTLVTESHVKLGPVNSGVVAKRFYNS